MLSSTVTWRGNADSSNSSSDYISRLWKQQRALLIREDNLLEQARHHSYMHPKLKEASALVTMDNEASKTTNVFHSRVRPAINRGKTVILATDPEKHLQMMRERLEQQERKHHRLQNPEILNPVIEVKSLTRNRGSSLPLVQEVRQRHVPKTRGLTEAERLEEIWRSQIPIDSRTISIPWVADMYHSNTMLHLTPFNRMLNYTRNMLKLEPIQTDELKTMKDAKKEERIYLKSRHTKIPAIHDTKQSHNREYPTFLLEACSIQESEDTSVTTSPAGKSYTSTSVCNRYNKTSRTQTVEPPTIQVTKPQTSPASSENASAESKKSLVVQMPAIDFTPATPNITTPTKHKSGQRTANLPATTSRRIINPHKVQKQKELRERELKNLFSDIRELNSVNEQIHKSLPHMTRKKKST